MAIFPMQLIILVRQTEQKTHQCPGADSTLSNAEFAEAAATNLCLPSPACAERLGDTVKGQRKVDMYGYIVQATNTPGDHWRLRHYHIKHVIGRLCCQNCPICKAAESNSLLHQLILFYNQTR